MSNQNILDLLNGTIDGLAEMEVFKAWPTGQYLCSFDHEVTDKGVTLKFKHIETRELSVPERESEIKPDASQNIFCNFFDKEGKPNSFGQGQVRLMVELFAETFGGATPLETLGNATGAQVIVNFGERTNKDDPDAPFAALKKVVLAD